MKNQAGVVLLVVCCAAGLAMGEDFPKPYVPPCVERENVFEFAEKPAVKALGNDRYEITFAVKGNCDVTVAVIDSDGRVIRHLASGVLGGNAPTPFQKNSLKQAISWNGKDDLEEYCKTPEKLRVRVMLGLKPVFDKRLGGTSGKNIPGTVLGLVVDESGAYVLSRGTFAGFGQATIRKFDRDGNYLCALDPPPASLPESKLGGMGFVEYEPGKRAVHGPALQESEGTTAWFMPPATLDGNYVASCQPAIAGGRLFFANGGQMHGSPGSFLHYVYSDGSRDLRGVKGLPLAKNVTHVNSRLAVSPDGKKLYLSAARHGNESGPSTAVYVKSLDDDKEATVFAGEPGKPGSDQQHLADAQGIDCDTEGRVYIADSVNNRIQVFSADAKLLKTIPVDRPSLICVHKKTGAVYVQHPARVEGRSVARLTKLISFADPREEFHVDGFDGLMALDSWSAKPRLWLSGKHRLNRSADMFDSHVSFFSSGSVSVWEERGQKLEKLVDFEAEAIKEAGASWLGRWNGVGNNVIFAKMVCDPTREKAYYNNRHIFNLVTGVYEGTARMPGADDYSFDKHGYMHGHAAMAGVYRLDPAGAKAGQDQSGKFVTYPECPYDYGVEGNGLRGVVPVKDQAGAKGFQDGMGVNMRGDLVVESNIYYVPKMEDEVRAGAIAGGKAMLAGGTYNEESGSYDGWMRSVLDAQKRGEEVYSVRRAPGIPLTKSTIWTFKRNGELWQQNPVSIGALMNGVHIDEEGYVYFSMGYSRSLDGKPFLGGKGGVFGAGNQKQDPPTYVFAKGRPENLKILLANAPIQMDEPPKRPPELCGKVWVEGAEWLYAGYGPMPVGGCECWSSRFHLDWYKRSFIPENYRHSIGILDTNGNLIMHLGRYGNFDTAPGGKDGAKPGGTDIGVTCPRYIGGTDNYLCFGDMDDRIIVLRLNYQAEETVGIGGK
ncbi:MAG: hypothetical protein C0404_12290 [Verrucomicrobia bacterium]|nr:hypothetical protein [Verrucomicrobiota bacterium]